MASITIWTTYHRDDMIAAYGLMDRVKDGVHKLLPVHHAPGPGIDNIHYANSFMSEMVSMWYIWRNGIRSDMVGFDHYRRELRIRGTLPERGETLVYQTMDFGRVTVLRQFAMSHGNRMMDISLDVLDEYSGKGNAYTYYIVNGTKLISRCCFLMHWEDFCSLASWLFPLLERVAGRILGSTDGEHPFGTERQWRENMCNVQGTRRHALRILSCIAERFISAYIMVNMKWRLAESDGPMNCVGGEFIATPQECITMATVNYNTPDLVTAGIMSIAKHVPDIDRVVVMDNSDKTPLVDVGHLGLDFAVDVIDNTKGEIIDFDRWLEGYPHRMTNDPANLGTAKHTRSVQTIMEYLSVPFFLFDSDVLLRRDVSCLADDRCAWVGETVNKRRWTRRLIPFLCYINTRMAKEHGVTYFNEDFMYGIHRTPEAARFDTGAWFCKDCADHGLPYREVSISPWIDHMRNGSWKVKDRRTWLEQRRELWSLDV